MGKSRQFGVQSMKSPAMGCFTVVPCSAAASWWPERWAQGRRSFNRRRGGALERSALELSNRAT